MTNDHDVYSSDSPVVVQSQDQFNRFPFAKRVASVISKRKDPSSIVIGIYGAWGEGKTSIFNFIEGELNNEEHVVCIRFNPWRYGEEEEMLISFFNDMATSID
ncbi:P-loop NTPase fold protein [Bacillus cereus group sp. MYBK111-1]